MTKSANNKAGQAVIEYLLVLVFISFIGASFVKGMSGFIGEQIGSLTEIVSSHLTTGVCQSECFFDDYSNGRTP